MAQPTRDTTPTDTRRDTARHTTRDRNSLTAVRCCALCVRLSHRHAPARRRAPSLVLPRSLRCHTNNTALKSHRISMYSGTSHNASCLLQSLSSSRSTVCGITTGRLRQLVQINGCRAAVCRTGAYLNLSGPVTLIAAVHKADSSPHGWST